MRRWPTHDNRSTSVSIRGRGNLYRARKISDAKPEVTRPA
uniref:Uncharacterized protein n=1 Tax=Arundo donax TaxID=35708 RepID=A0A0A9FZ73_ARUDO